MFNEAHISLSGYVASQPALGETRSGVPAVTMRVAWTPRRIDRATGEWTDADTSFATVRCYRRLAENAATCLRKGDPVVVRGRVSVRDFESRDGQPRTNVEIDAQSVGHDLGHGIATFHRIRPQTGMTAAEFRAAEEAGLSGGMGGSGGSDPYGVSVSDVDAGGLAPDALPARVAGYDAGADVKGDPGMDSDLGDGPESAGDDPESASDDSERAGDDAGGAGENGGSGGEDLIVRKRARKVSALAQV